MENIKDEIKDMLIRADAQSIFDWLEKAGYFEVPASASHHGNYEGALAEHCLKVAEYLQSLTDTQKLEWQRPQSPILIGLLHDVCKIDQYQKIYRDDSVKYEYKNDCLFYGHGIKSIAMIASHMILTEEEIACILYHMGAFTDSKEWSYYSGAVRKYPNVLWTHTADMLASQVDGI